jgi:hypothetical protein
MAAKSKVTRVLYVAVWPLGWSFGFVMGSCFRRTEKKWRPPRHKRPAGWRQATEAGTENAPAEHSECGAKR